MTVAASHLAPVLEDVMHARGCGLAEQRLLVNRTPDVDSLVEAIIAAGLPRETTRKLLAYCGQIIELNNLQGEHERQAAGQLDELLRLARDAQLNHDKPDALTVKEIGRRLRPALRIIANPAGIDALAYVTAVRAVDDVIAAVPSHRLFTPSVERELRAHGFALLRRLHESRSAA